MNDLRLHRLILRFNLSQERENHVQSEKIAQDLDLDIKIALCSDPQGILLYYYLKTYYIQENPLEYYLQYVSKTR